MIQDGLFPEQKKKKKKQRPLSCKRRTKSIHIVTERFIDDQYARYLIYYCCKRLICINNASTPGY